MRSWRRYALLDVEARFLYLGEQVRALPGEAGVVLRPEVSAVIEGRVLPPLGVKLPVDAARWEGVTVVCGSTPLHLDDREDLDGNAIVPRGDGSFVLPFVAIEDA